MYLFFRTGFTCAHLKSSGNKPGHIDAFMMYVIGQINSSRHAFRGMVRIGSKSQDLLGDDNDYFS